MGYPKKFMTISELEKMGMSRFVLNRYVHIKGFPARKTSAGKTAKFLIDTDRLDTWMERYGGRV